MGNSAVQPRYFSGDEVEEILTTGTLADIKAFLEFHCPRDRYLYRDLVGILSGHFRHPDAGNDRGTVLYLRLWGALTGDHASAEVTPEELVCGLAAILGPSREMMMRFLFCVYASSSSSAAEPVVWPRELQLRDEPAARRAAGQQVHLLRARLRLSVGVGVGVRVGRSGVARLGLRPGHGLAFVGSRLARAR